MNIRSATIDYIKGLSIISVICAHCNAVVSSTSAFMDGCSLLLQNMGTFGVICFMVISGMLFACPKDGKAAFFGKKLKRIMIPWIISATCVWLYVYLRQPPLTLESWMNFLIGNGSYLYYLTMLMLFYMIFSILPFMRTGVVLLICEVVTIISCVWFYQIGSLSPYLNPLNWIGFFALGMHISQYKDTIVRGGGTNKLIMYAVWILSLSALVIQLLRQDGGYYWGGFRAIVSWLGAGSVALLGVQLARMKDAGMLRLLRSAGENSFFIYIWHMPIAGIVARLMSIGPLQYLTLLRPFVVLAVVMAAGQLATLLLKKFNLQKYAFLVGLNRR